MAIVFQMKRQGIINKRLLVGLKLYGNSGGDAEARGSRIA